MDEQEKLELLDYYISAAREALALVEESDNEDVRTTSMAELRGLLHQAYQKIRNWRS